MASIFFLLRLLFLLGGDMWGLDRWSGGLFWLGQRYCVVVEDDVRYILLCQLGCYGDQCGSMIMIRNYETNTYLIHSLDICIVTRTYVD